MNSQDEAILLLHILLKELTEKAIAESALATLNAYREIPVEVIISATQRELSTQDVSRSAIAGIILKSLQVRMTDE